MVRDQSSGQGVVISMEARCFLFYLDGDQGKHFSLSLSLVFETPRDGDGDRVLLSAATVCVTAAARLTTVTGPK